MKAQHQEKIENLQKGHGRYHEICQDDFLNDVLKSKNTLVHFYHADFENCKVIDHHLAILPEPRRVQDDEDGRGQVAVLRAEVAVCVRRPSPPSSPPTVVVFKDGTTSPRLVGFDALTDDLKAGHENEFKTEVSGGLAREGAVASSTRRPPRGELAASSCEACARRAA